MNDPFAFSRLIPAPQDPASAAPCAHPCQDASGGALSEAESEAESESRPSVARTAQPLWCPEST
ncbi:hypothetical protein [Streptomyces sp. Da 82-17]|uniref:hypothetical protein n=1 Tax=Streptomyces sp. Da 82-17 TaxID=3377116 RepID=UPI0038D40D0A